MVLKLSLPESKMLWALNNPVSNEYIKSEGGKGYQDCSLIITHLMEQPVEVELNEYPQWAQVMIKTAVHRGDLINTGESIVAKPAEAKAEEVRVEEQDKENTTKKKATKKKATRRSRKQKDE